jgi:hypothetical protein
MQVSSAPGQMSALDVWLRETEPVASPGGTPSTAAGARAAARELETSAPRDIAEKLLDLPVWIAAGSKDGAAVVVFRQLVTDDPGPTHADALSSKQWVQHIFAPLEPQA